jgi:hypothetical protein
MDSGQVGVHVPFSLRNSFKSYYRLSDNTTASGNPLCLLNLSLLSEVSRFDTKSLDSCAHIFDMVR